jgi:hypothetical protein
MKTNLMLGLALPEECLKTPGFRAEGGFARKVNMGQRRLLVQFGFKFHTWVMIRFQSGALG